MNRSKARKRLEEEQARLLELRSQLLRDALNGESGMGELSVVDQHPADVGTERFERDKDFAIMQQVDGELKDIEHALRRVESGTYGKCEACGRVINPDRLEFRPATRYCVEDQAKFERMARAESVNSRDQRMPA